MKYRIVQTSKGFHIQYRFLGLFWRDHKEYYIAKIGYNKEKWCWRERRKWVFSSLEETKEALNLAKTFPIKYRKHPIKYGRLIGGKVFYYDVCSYLGDAEYGRASESLEKLKKEIDDLLYKKELEKQIKRDKKRAKQIINVWYQE